MTAIEVIPPDAHDIAPRVHALAKALHEQCQGLLKQTRVIALTGYDLGALLGEASDVMEQGDFACLLDAAQIKHGTATRLIAISEKYSREEVELRSDPQRQLVFALNAVPEKEQPEHQGNGQVHVTAGVGTAVIHWRKWRAQIDRGMATLDVELAKVQTREMYEWLREIHEGEA